MDGLRLRGKRRTCPAPCPQSDASSLARCWDSRAKFFVFRYNFPSGSYCSTRVQKAPFKQDDCRESLSGPIIQEQPSSKVHKSPDIIRHAVQGSLCPVFPRNLTVCASHCVLLYRYPPSSPLCTTWLILYPPSLTLLGILQTVAIPNRQFT